MTKKKKDFHITLPRDIGSDFEESDHVLNYRPNIDFVQPDDSFFEEEDEPIDTTLDDVRDRTQALIDGYKDVVKLVDVAKKRIDDRVKAEGGLTIQLDPNTDAATIAAIQRRFPNADPNKLTYDMYKSALECLNSQTPEVPGVTADDIKQAKTDPLKTNFGGLDSPPGENRPERGENNISPVDLDAFQSAATIALFALLLPMITSNTEAAIAKHTVTVPHT